MQHQNAGQHPIVLCSKAWRYTGYAVPYQQINDFNWRSRRAHGRLRARSEYLGRPARASGRVNHTEISMGPNPFAAVAEFGSPLAMKIYVILMIAAVIIGTLSSASRTKGTASTSRNGVKDRERPRAARPPAAHIL